MLLLALALLPALGSDSGFAYDPSTLWEGADTITVGGGTSSGGCDIKPDGSLSCFYDCGSNCIMLSATASQVVWDPPSGPVYSIDADGTANVWRFEADDHDDVGYYFAPMAPWTFMTPMLVLPFFSGDLFSALMLLLSWTVVMRFWFRVGQRVRMGAEPATPAVPPPDGLLDAFMTRVFGRSWRTGLSGFAGVCLSIAAAVMSVEPPFTFVKLAPLMPGLVASLGLMVAKDGKVSGKPS